jgi:hypothetical protein
VQFHRASAANFSTTSRMRGRVTTLLLLRNRTTASVANVQDLHGLGLDHE